MFWGLGVAYASCSFLGPMHPQQALGSLKADGSNVRKLLVVVQSPENHAAFLV